MKFLFTADVHAHNFSQFATRNEKGINTRLSDVLNVLSQFADVCRSQQVDAAFILGDLFHSRTKLDIDVLAMIHESICAIANSCSALFILVGNHDQHTLVGNVHSLVPFNSIQNVVVIDKPSVFPIGNTKFAAHPYTKDISALMQWMVETVPVDMMLLHQGLREAMLGFGDKTGIGDLSTERIPISMISRYVFLGDYHKRQFLCDGKVHYVGSPRQQDFGEAGEEKAFSLIDTTDWVVKSIPTGAPRFFKFDSGDLLAEAIKKKRVDPYRDYIKVLDDNIPASLKNLERIQVIPLVESQEAIKRVDEEVVGNDFLLLREYVRQRGDDRDDLLSAGLQFLQGE